MAKQIVKDFLDHYSITYTKLTGKTISFVDLARNYWVQITIHGCRGGEWMLELKDRAKDNHFGVHVDLY